MTTIYDLQPGSILLAPSYLHASIREALLQSQTGYLHIKIHTLQGWLLGQTNVCVDAEHVILYQYRERIQRICEDLKIYKEAACSPVFLNECRAFLDSLCFWDIPLDALPQITEAQKELFTILSQFTDITLPSAQLRSACTNLAGEILSHVYILDVFHTLEEEQLIQQLVSQGAHMCKPVKHQPKTAFYHAVNKRQEIEACAQYIIEQDMDADTIHITLANASYKPILAQVFDRYHIPYTILQSAYSSHIPHLFTAIFAFYLHPDTDHLHALLDSGVFQNDQLQKLKDYLDVFQCDIEQPFTHLQQIQEFGNVLDAIELEKLKKLEEQAENVRIQLVDWIKPLCSPSSIQQLIYTADSYVRMCLTEKEADTHLLLRIEQMLQDVYPYIHTKEDLDFFLYFLEGMSQSSSAKSRNGVLIADLHQSLFAREHLFLLGCTQKDYPAFQTKEGIFDETYHALISAYPSMETRYQFYMKQLSSFLVSAPFLYVSYPLGTYEGKGMEAALEIEQFMNKDAEPVQLQEAYEPLCADLSLTSEMAKSLFVKNGIIHGSISALERYVKCPFSYFLRYGLSLREPMKIGFPDSYAGTLSHYLLETFTGQFGKAYTKVTKEKIEAVLMKEITIMRDIFPSLEKKLENVAQRLLTSMIQMLSLLDEFEQHSLLSPHKSEQEFKYTLPVNDEVAFALKGYIDRIDASDEFLCILDYKSSVKTLSETNVFAALQLQLLTYSIVCNKAFQKRVLGAFYVSLKNENIPHPAGKLSRRKPATYLSIGKEELEEARRKAHRLNGWVMDQDIQALDDDGSHIVGVTQNKDGIIKPRKLYDLERLEHYFTKMYQIIAERILDGDIRCAPIEEACMFCDYHEICRFKGIYAEKTPLVVVEDDIYQQQKGREEDA